MRTTYLFTAAAALLVASIPAFADGECMQWQRGRNGAIVQACVAPGTDAAGYGVAFAEEDPIGNTGEPGILYASPKGDLTFVPATYCPECGVADESDMQQGQDHEDED
jgi:hypothetical protein